MMKYMFHKVLKKAVDIVLLFLPICLVTAQVPVPATVENSNPSDNQILDALNGGGMTLFLNQGDGLVHGVRNQQIVIFKDGEQAGFGMNEGVFFSTGNAGKHLAQRNEEFAVGDE